MRSAGCAFVLTLGAALSLAGQTPSVPASGVVTSIPSNQTVVSQPDPAVLQRELAAIRQREEDLRKENDELREKLSRTPQLYLKYPVLEQLVPLSAAGLSVLALLWAAVLTVQSREAGKLARAGLSEAQEELTHLKRELQSYQAGLIQNKPQSKSQGRPEPAAPRSKALAPQKAPLRSERQRDPVPAPLPQPEEPALQPEPVLEQLSVEPALSVPAELPADAPAMTGDLLRDYALARRLEPDGPELFHEHYRPFGLSCMNLNDARLGEARALRFHEAPRGMFLAVRQNGETLVVPPLDKDFSAVRQSLEGVFTFPADWEGATRLLRPATVRKVGDEWTLQSPGEIARG